MVDDYMTMDLAGLGTFDVVLYLGVLYHIENPLQALRRLAAVTDRVRSAGFRKVQVVIGPPSWPRWLAHTARARIRHENPGNPRIGVPVRRCRAVVHAFT